MRSQYLNLQAAQKTINKKADAVPVYSAEKVRSSLSELRQGLQRNLLIMKKNQ